MTDYEVARAARGIYFLANDSMADFAIAFLNSVRAYNPNLPVCLIPFNDQVDEIMTLQKTFAFSVVDQSSILSRCDNISIQFHSKIVGHYRKLAAWEGPFESFIYIDVDSVVLHSLDFVFKFLDVFDFVTAHSYEPGYSTAHWVWKESVHSSEKLDNEQIAFCANTGFIASQKASLPIQDITRHVLTALDVKSHMDLRTFEQPFLNYLIVTSGKPYTSLLSLKLSATSRQIPLELEWQDIAIVQNGRVLTTKNCTGRAVLSDILMVHWYGEPGKMAARKSPLWKFYRDLPFRRTPNRLLKK